VILQWSPPIEASSAAIARSIASSGLSRLHDSSAGAMRVRAPRQVPNRNAIECAISFTLAQPKSAASIALAARSGPLQNADLARATILVRTADGLTAERAEHARREGLGNESEAARTLRNILEHPADFARDAANAAGELANSFGKPLVIAIVATLVAGVVAKVLTK
jgi:hypothetical protein